MTIEVSFTNEYMSEDGNKNLVYLKKNQLHISNQIDPKFLPFFKEMVAEYDEIVYFEHDKPVCPHCNVEMNSNGSRESKPNMLEGIRIKQYVCPICGKTQTTSLKEFIPRNCNYSYDIVTKGLIYDCIGYLPYEAKSGFIEFENDVPIDRRTVYYLQSEYADAFLKEQE